jgi:ribose/xylose/arabinose/galactoside ABC-type transport system permease subunit
MATPARVAPANRMPTALLGHEIVLAVILVVSLAVLATQTDRFLTTSNLLNQGRLMAEVGLVALPMTFIIITASVVGGVSILGGTGTVIGSTLAAILLAAIGSALIFVNLSPYWLRAVQGVLILATVLADLMRRRRQARG